NFDRSVAVPVVPVKHCLSPRPARPAPRMPPGSTPYAGYAAIPGTGRHLGLILLAVHVGRGQRPSSAAALRSRQDTSGTGQDICVHQIDGLVLPGPDPGFSMIASAPACRRVSYEPFSSEEVAWSWPLRHRAATPRRLVPRPSPLSTFSG